MVNRLFAAVCALAAAGCIAACSSSTVNGTGRGSTGASASHGGSMPPSSNSSAPSSITGLAQKLLAGIQHVSSAHISLSVNLAGQSVTGSGDEKLSNGKLQALDLSESIPSAGQLRLIYVGGKTYAKLPASLQTGSKPYVLVSPNSSNPVIAQLGSSLGTALNAASLRTYGIFVHAAKSVKLVGSDTVGGVQATKYHVVVDARKVPSSLLSKQALQSSGIKTVPVDLWIDSEDRPVQVVENLTVQGQTVSVKASITRYNQPVTITAPPASQVSTH
jgi:hypothetical protein